MLPRIRGIARVATLLVMVVLDPRLAGAAPVLCVGADGHVALEAACGTSDRSVPAAPGDLLESDPCDDHCGPCVDRPASHPVGDRVTSPRAAPNPDAASPRALCATPGPADATIRLAGGDPPPRFVPIRIRAGTVLRF